MRLVAEACQILDKPESKLATGERFLRDVKGGFINFMPQTSVYVRSLPDGTTEDDLFKTFSPCGTVLSA